MNKGRAVNEPLTVEEFLRAIPKVELHCHLLGTVRYETFLDLATKRKAPLARQEIDAFYERGEKPVGAIRVLRALDAHLLVKPDDLYRITREYLEDARAHGVLYSEFFWNPTGTARVSQIPYDKALDGIVAAMRDAARDLGILSRLIPSIDREAEPEAAVEMVEWIVRHRRPEVIGIGMDYTETDRPPELFWKAYRLAKQAGLKTTAHAGEFGMKWTNVETAVELLGVDRVDHGYTVIDNPGFAKKCAERRLLFTVVPTNTYYLRTLPRERWALDHPIRQMPKLGLAIHPNTDDPTLHKVTPTGAWHMMMKDFGFGLDDLKSFMVNGLDGAWIEDEVRGRWKSEWAATFDELRARVNA